MGENKNRKRMLSIELDDDVKKVSIIALNDEEKVVMKQELDESDLALITGGDCPYGPPTPQCNEHYGPPPCTQVNPCGSYQQPVAPPECQAKWLPNQCPYKTV